MAFAFAFCFLVVAAARYVKIKQAATPHVPEARVHIWGAALVGGRLLWWYVVCGICWQNSVPGGLEPKTPRPSGGDSGRWRRRRRRWGALVLPPSAKVLASDAYGRIPGEANRPPEALRLVYLDIPLPFSASSEVRGYEACIHPFPLEVARENHDLGLELTAVGMGGAV